MDLFPHAVLVRTRGVETTQRILQRYGPIGPFQAFALQPAGKLLVALAEAEGVTQGALVERLATSLAKRKHSALCQGYQRAYW